jgi:CRP-like cAMP-binding protein
MAGQNQVRFDPEVFLAQAGLGRRIVRLNPKEAFFSQGDTADCVYYLQSGRAKLTVISKEGKEATIALLTAGNFVGEDSMAGTPGLRMATATAIAPCSALKIERAEMIRVMHEEHAFSDMFLKFLLERSMRTQADLVDQLFNSSEKRLARILLLMADFGQARRTGVPDSQNFAGDAGGDDRDHAVARQLLYESLSEAGFYRIQRRHKSTQITLECGPPRLNCLPAFTYASR